MKRSFIVLLFLNLQFAICNLQSFAQDTAQKGQIKIYQDKRIVDLVNLHIANNEKNKTIPGFRIQIASDTKRDLVLEKKSEFVQQFPNMKIYLTYQQPNFKLRAGNFRSRLEAQKFQQEILTLFNSAFIVKDEIEIAETE